jgi:ABC-type antimicrobial peptide transport system permease subunit
MVLREGTQVTVAGMALGAPVVWWSARYLEKELFRMKALEPVTLAVTTGILLAASLMAVWIPAYRASGMQPTEALRQD